MDRIAVRAPAKVNLVLHVLGRRPDGYHDLRMVMVPVGLFDEVELSPIPSGIELSVLGSADRGMQGHDNIAWRAARMMQEEAGRQDGVRIVLKKRIPLAAGLGGGSSDAAAVLRGLSRLWGLDWDAKRLMEIGRRLGADVPFFCQDRPALVEGIGDRVIPYEELPKLLLLLVNPGFSVSTKEIYEGWDRAHADSMRRRSAATENEGLTGEG